jgi:hypothetical protein
MKISNSIFWVIAGVVIILLVLYNQNYKKNSDQSVGLKVHYYLNGKEVSNNLFSMVGGEYYDQIAIDITAYAVGNFYNIKIDDAGPSPFKNALPTTTRYLSSGENKVLWTSGLINTSQLESYSQPIRFYVNVSGISNTTQSIYYSKANIDLTIKPAVKMRFDSLTRTGAIAFADTCGQELQRYGYSYSTTCLGSPYTGSSCPAAGTIIPGFILLLDKSTVLEPPNWAQSYACIYQNVTSSNSIGVAWRVKGNGGQACTISNAWILYVYNLNSEANISESASSVNSSLEIYC